MWRHRSGSAFVQVIACCLTAPSHYPNKWWLIIKGLLWHAPEAIPQEMLMILIHNVFRVDAFKITMTFLWGHWVNDSWPPFHVQYWDLYGHQQPYYWSYRTNSHSHSLPRGRVSTTSVISVLRNYTKYKYVFMFHENNSTYSGLNPL